MTNHLFIFSTFQQALQDTVQSLANSGMLWLLLSSGFVWAISLVSNSKSGKISTGRFGGWTERWTARIIAQKQRKERKPYKVALRAGNVDIPHAQQSVIVAGSPDSGKTYSIIDPAIRSAIAAELPILVYDFKGSQLETHAAWAASQGYQVDVFAPGQPYTSVCNPLDFLEDATDSLMASQLAQVLQRNTQRESYREMTFLAMLELTWSKL